MVKSVKSAVDKKLAKAPKANANPEWKKLMKEFRPIIKAVKGQVLKAEKKLPSHVTIGDEQYKLEPVQENRELGRRLMNDDLEPVTVPSQYILESKTRKKGEIRSISVTVPRVGNEKGKISMLGISKILDRDTEEHFTLTTDSEIIIHRVDGTQKRTRITAEKTQ